MGWWHAARSPEPACPDGWRHPGPNRGVLTRASRRDGSPELTPHAAPPRADRATATRLARPNPNAASERPSQPPLSRCCDNHLNPRVAALLIVLAFRHQLSTALTISASLAQ